MNNLTQEQLKKILHYDPETGVWTWLVSRGRIPKGSVAGTIGSVEGYRSISINHHRYRSGRLAFFYMTGRWPIQVDHINRIRDDDRWVNLREADNSQNNCNRDLQKNNTSGASGVCWAKNKSKWLVQVGVKGKLIYFGLYEDKELADLVCSEAKAKYHKEFAASERTYA
ncbi:MAG: HNH endonuclease [Mixta calida]|uniref:HNH endonuclease n=1 Tax=Mixta calida TaxID=665913 RepID=UPI00290B38D4|nr:HNH endonuclease [Mixta calida]MDU4943950.1 HNH endonuclease [Mixta calida]